MKGQVIIVTGASNGMGKYMAKKFVEEGANVVIVGRDLERLNEAKKEIQHENGQVLPIVADVRDVEAVQAMVDQTVAEFGRIDHLVNNAAGNFVCAAEDLSPNGWKTVIDIVLNGSFYCSRAVGKHMIDNGIKGSILNMIATYAWDAGPGTIHSASAKAGVLSMTRTLAVEWGRKYGIRVNALAPGPIERTGGAMKLWGNEEAAQRTLDAVPLGRLGTPEEVAEIAAFLLSDKAAYINGECLTMDGGAFLKQSSF